MGQRNVQLRCYVDSRPSPASLFWLTEANVTVSAATAASDPPAVVPVAAAAGQYSTLVRVRFFSEYSMCTLPALIALLIVQCEMLGNS